MKNLAQSFLSLFFAAVIIVAGLKFWKGAQAVGGTVFHGFSGLGQTIISGGQYGPYSSNQSSH